MKLLRETLEANKARYIKNLTDFIAIDTQDLGHGIKGGREKVGQEFLAELFRNMGASSIEKDPMTEKIIAESIKLHHEGNPGHNYEDRFNVYASFKGERNKSVMFNGHVDTMPPGDEKLWNTPPHAPVINDGKLYGLGAADMKGGLMAAIMAVELLRDARIPLPVDVLYTAVCDEEGGGNGSILAAMNGQKADAVVVCEPSSKELIVAHMGFIFMKIQIEGKANHSGAKWLGVSAIEKAVLLMERLNQLEHRWLLVYKHPLLPAPNLNVGTIHGGSAGSTVAGNCEFEICIHYLPIKMTYGQVVEEVTGEINRFAQSDLWLKDHLPLVDVYQSGGSFEMEDHPLLSVFSKAYETVTGAQAVLAGSPAGCDSRIWKNIAQCPTLQFGPGNLEQCHAVNEYLSVDEYLETIIIYAQFILDWGKQGGTNE